MATSSMLGYVNEQELNAAISGVDRKVSSLDASVSALDVELNKRFSKLVGEEIQKRLLIEEKFDKLGRELPVRFTNIERDIASSKTELSVRIDKIGEEIKGLEKGLTDRLDKFDTSIARFDNKVGEILGKIDGVDFVSVKSIDYGALQASINDRKEYQELWKAQKIEATAIENLVELRGDPEIQALIEQKGLGVAISRRDVQKLAVAKEQLKDALGKYPDSVAGKNARMLANLAYAYVLMAQHYKAAREHVTAVVGEKTAIETMIWIGEEAIKAALVAGLSAVTAGVAGVLLPSVMEFIKNAKQSLQNSGAAAGGLVTQGTTSSTPVSQQIDTALGQYKQDRALTSVGAAVGDLGTGKIAPLIIRSAGGAMQDPYDFFLAREAQLRKAAAYLLSSPPESHELMSRSITVQLDRDYTLVELAANPAWNFFFTVQQNPSELNAIWERVSQLLAVSMRRQCWRTYCRGQWNNTLLGYTIGVDKAAAEATAGISLEGPASEWNYKVWVPVHLVMPRHWEKICADFRGPEHDPTNPYTIRAGQLHETRLRFVNYAWISMAAVQCCQIRRSFEDMYLDLEKRRHIGGRESEPLEMPQDFTDKLLLFGARGGSEFENFLRNIETTPRLDVAISEIRFGRASKADWKSGFGFFNNWSRSSGKKGTLTSSSETLAISQGMNMTVMVGRKGADGAAARSGGENATVLVYRANKLKHSDGTLCAKVEHKQLCWYCEHTDADVKGKRIPNTFRLVEVDRAESGSRIFSGDGWNYQNFPTSTSTSNDSYAYVAGLYCVMLHPRRDLTELQGTGGKFQHHVTDPWWFTITDVSDPPEAPGRPTIDWGTESLRGKVSISGHYNKGLANDPDIPVLIHLRIGEKIYGPVEKTPSGGAPVDWKISGFPALRGGETLQATATWAPSDDRGPAQTMGESHWILPNHISIEEDSVGIESSHIRGYCDAVEGVQIQIAVNGIWNPSTIRLHGKRSEENGMITWRRQLQNPLSDKQFVRARVLPPGERDLQNPRISKNSTHNVSVYKRTPPPIIDKPSAGDKKVTGSVMLFKDGIVKIQIAPADPKTLLVDISKTFSLVGCTPDDDGRCRWEISDLTPYTFGQLQAGDEVVAHVASNKYGTSVYIGAKVD